MCGDHYGAPFNAHVILQCQCMICAHVLFHATCALSNKGLCCCYVECSVYVVHQWMRSVLQPTSRGYPFMRAINGFMRSCGL